MQLAVPRRRAAPLALGLVFALAPSARAETDTLSVAEREDHSPYLTAQATGAPSVIWIASAPDAPPRLSAVFRREERFVAHPLDAVRGLLELAWATTVHKAQGSEHDEVALLLPEQDLPRLLTREVVYTAITRARRVVHVVGEPALLARAIRRRVERSTGIGERLG